MCHQQDKWIGNCKARSLNLRCCCNWKETWKWCFNFPDIFELSTKFLNTKNRWLKQLVTTGDNRKYKSKDVIDGIISDLSGNNLIKVQLVKIEIDVATIPYSQSSKSKLCLWVNPTKTCSLLNEGMKLVKKLTTWVSAYYFI